VHHPRPDDPAYPPDDGVYNDGDSEGFAPVESLLLIIRGERLPFSAYLQWDGALPHRKRMFLAFAARSE